MAVYEKSGVLNWIDKNGNKNILYPVTTTDNVDGLDTELAGKVDKTSIVDNLTSADTDKPLSAKQGKTLKGLVDGKASMTDVNNAISSAIGTVINANY